MNERYRQMLVGLEHGTLPPEGFTHADHVGVAATALRHYPFFHALAVVAQGLQRLTRRAGQPEKFNATLTMASMSLIAELLWTDSTLDPATLVSKHADLLRLNRIRMLYPLHDFESQMAREIGLLHRDRELPLFAGGSCIASGNK